MTNAARARMESWKASLLDLSIDNPLIDAFGLELIAEPLSLAAALAAGGGLAIESGTAAAEGRLVASLAPAELVRELVALRRDAAASRTAHGEHPLWIAIGMLAWSDGGDRMRRAPLALWPVELEQVPGGTPRLISAVEPGWLEPQLNATLVEKLRRDFDLVLAGSVAELPALFEAAAGIALMRPGWKVERGALLGCFAPHQVSIWRDLEGREEALLAHPLVAQLARGKEGLGFAQPSGAAAAAVTGRPGSIDLGGLLAPLDADATQLQAVAAAGTGASFVLQAPPGTGATQTIANLIVHCTATGKSMLLVSDKLAALEAIRERLSSVGLGDLVLPLTARGAALAQLERVLSRAFRPHHPALHDGGTRLDELRGVLDGHATSLHRIGAFGRSLHDVLGRLVELRTTPRAALADMDAVGLDAATFAQRLAAVERLAAAAEKVDPVASHPWRASKLDQATFGVPATGRARALAAIDEAAAAAAALGTAIRDVASLIPNLVARSRDQLTALGALGTHAASSPRPGAELLTATRNRASAEQLDEQIALIRARGGEKAALETPRDPHAFLLLARRHRALAAEVRERFTDGIDGIDAAGLWAQLKKWTHSMAPVRFVALRAARAEVKAVAQPLELETDAAMIEALEAVIAERACRAALEACAEPARRWFGELGGAPLSLDLEAIEAAAKWGSELRRVFDTVDVIGGDAGREAAWRALVAHVASGPGDAHDAGGVAIDVLARLGREVARWAGTLGELAAATGIELRADDLGDHLAMLGERTATLRHAIDQLADWVAFHDARHRALASGVGPAVAAIERGDLAAPELAPAWERATLLAWADAELADSLVADGAAHHAHVSAFADLDRAALAMVRSRALVRFAERVPAVPPGKLDPDTELGGLLTDLRANKPTPLRAMFAGIPLLLPRVAPCIAVTPAALAAHLDPKLTFDVVVFDRSSQLPTAAAIGALSRAASAVIVGDSQLLPPLAMVRETSAELEGLLADAIASRLPELRLGWHYRGRHEDVIAYANEKFYGDRLQLFPAMAASADLGLAVRSLGRAPELVAELLSRLRDPAQQGRSVGLVTFSRTLRDQILDLIDDARRDEPLLDALTEPLAVEHVDDAQGLVRDVVLVVLDESALEPRRLCVALTRAREQLVLCTGGLPDRLGDFATLLSRANASSSAIEQAPASPISDAIARALADRGWAVRHQVGSGGYKIDLAVLDPADPDRYVLAIETDGAAYASAPVARDRDRLRAQVLTQLGWRLHRIWALDWWANPEGEIARAHAAIVTAIAATRRRAVPAPAIRAPRVARGTARAVVGIGHADTQPQLSAPVTAPSAPSGPASVAPSGPVPRGLVARESSAPIGDIPETMKTMPNLAAGSAPIRIAKNQIPIGPYVAAAIPPGRRTPDDLFAPRHLPELKKVIEQVLAAEAPMHVDLLARRVGAYFGIGRVTPRVTDQIRTVLEGRGKLGDEQDIVWRLDQDPAGVPAVRVAGTSGTATTRREIAEIPLSELAAAARIVVERSSTIATTDLVRDAARLIGFARITPQVSERVAEGVRLAQLRELIRIDAGKARMPD